jgi:glutathione S-transferase
MTITISVFDTSPDRGRGLARDMAVRWALTEVRQPYAVRTVSFAAMKEQEYRARQPFGQIPAYEEGDLVLFESGAIVLHIAESHAGLLPIDPAARARTITWMFAAFSSIEPPLVEYSMSAVFERDKSWFGERQPMLEQRLRTKLADLSTRLGEADWLERSFSAGDLVMITVLRRLGSSGFLTEYPNLAAYVARGEARSAFREAFEAQLALFKASSG